VQLRGGEIVRKVPNGTFSGSFFTKNFDAFALSKIQFILHISKTFCIFSESLVYRQNNSKKNAAKFV